MNKQTTALAVAQSFLDHFEYKPGWTFKIIEDDPLHLWIWAEVTDAYDSTNTVVLQSCHHISPIVIEAAKDAPKLFYDILRKAIISMETHEVDEWMRVDGERWWNPHV